MTVNKFNKTLVSIIILYNNIGIPTNNGMKIMNAQIEAIIKVKLEEFQANKITREFAELESREAVAADIRNKTGSVTTEKAVAMMLINKKDKSVIERYEQYLSMAYTAMIQSWASQSA